MSRGVQRSSWMPRIMLLMLAVILTAIVVHEKLRHPPPTRAAAIGARLELAAGDVRVDQGEGEKSAISQTALRDDAKISTGAGARALVRLPDGSTAFMRGGTKLQLGGEAIALAQGEYWLDAPPVERGSLQHRMGEIGVTATDAGLSIRRTGKRVEVYVARGMAVLTAPGGRAEVHAGELAEVQAAGAPKVEPLAFWEDWTGGMADFGGAMATIAAGNGEIVGVDRGAPGGEPAARLQIKRQSVRVVIRHGLSETEVDQTFFNPSARAVEGWYWFSVPPGASVTGFAVETNGRLVEGEFIERKTAAKQYRAAKQTGHAPALLEWIDSGTYRARIFPIKPSTTRRVVLRYVELRPITQGKLSYVYPMASRRAMRIGELSVSVDLGAEGKHMRVSTLADARVEDGGRRVTMRRSGYTPRVDFQLEAEMLSQQPPLTVARYESGSDAADYLMARYTPAVDWSKASGRRTDVVVALDTSAAGDDASRRLETAAAEALLRALAPTDRFALVALDLAPQVLYPKKGLASAKEGEIAKALEALADRPAGGATDLGSLFEVGLGLVHDSPSPAVVYVGDGIATSGQRTGEQLIERLRRALSTSRARLYTVAVGPEADDALLGELARAGGGQSMRIDDARHATAKALRLIASMKVPTLTDFELDLGAGLDEPFVNVAGKVSRGSEVVLLARSHHDLPKTAVVRGRLGGERIEQQIEVKSDDSVVSAFVPRLWAAEYVRRLLGAAAGNAVDRGRVAELGIDYGLMTPFTSILALESEAAYRQRGIERRRSPLRGVRLTALDAWGERQLEARLHPPRGPLPVSFGCLERKLSHGDEQADPDEDSDDREGGHATRAKGEEMGRPSSGNSYGVTGPADNAEEVPTEAQSPTPDDPAVRRQAALREASEFGMVGTVDSTPPSAGEGFDVSRLGKSGHGLGGGGKAVTGGRVPAIEHDRVKDRSAAGEDLVPARLRQGTCSSVAARPLAQRVRVWRKRLGTVEDAKALLARHAGAMRACELSDWRSERAFLEMMVRHLKSEAGAKLLLGYLKARPDVQQYAAKLILRRTVDERIVAAVEQVLFGEAVDWAALDRKLSEIEPLPERIAALREAMARAPDDPNGIIRLVSLLAQAGRSDEALLLGRRLRDRGLMTLKIARELGDVLARAKQPDEAARTYSEIVEFDPDSVASRRLLGDIYLGRGWFHRAYRQYQSLVDAGPPDALGLLRLAHAAAGAGRTDEALRIDRQVASAEGRPGPDDPRRWARLWSAARLAQLLDKPPKGTSHAALQRKLKELGLLRGPSTLVLLSWRDLTSDVALVTRVDEQLVALGEPTDAASVGLAAVVLSPADHARAELSARLRSLPRSEPLVLRRTDLGWDGKKFAVKMRPIELPAGQTKVTL